MTRGGYRMERRYNFRAMQRGKEEGEKSGMERRENQ